MAKLTSILGDISGKLTDMVHARVVNGKNILARNPYFNLKRWLTSPKFARSRENTYNFTAESKLASSIYQGLNQAGKMNRLAGPYAHNAILSHIAPLFSKGLFGARHAMRIDPDIIARHMLALDISPAALKAKATPSTQRAANPHIYLSTDPCTQNPALRGSNQLVHLPDPSKIKANETLAYRLHTVHITIPVMAWDPNARTYQPLADTNASAESTPWLTWDRQALPASGTTPRSNSSFPTTTRAQVLANPNAVKQAGQDQPSLTFTIIEWRASIGNRHRFLRDSTTFFVSGITLSRHASLDLLLHAPAVQPTPAQIEAKHIRQHKLMPNSFSPAQLAPMPAAIHQFLSSEAHPESTPAAHESPAHIPDYTPATRSLMPDPKAQVTPEIPQIPMNRPLSTISGQQRGTNCPAPIPTSQGTRKQAGPIALKTSPS